MVIKREFGGIIDNMALGIKPNCLCDRDIYSFKGKWFNPNTREYENVFYYISSPLSYRTTYESGTEELKPTMEITIFGEKPIIERDIIILQDGSKMRVASRTINFVEHNINVRDMLKQRAENMVITLE